MNIVIRTIPHDFQRYPTCGDWEFSDDKEKLTITVSKLGDKYMEALIGIHEVIEAILCEKHGVLQKDVDEFDMQYEAARDEEDDSEPGDSPAAPYHVEHSIATGIERILAAELDVPWREYENLILDLDRNAMERVNE